MALPSLQWRRLPPRVLTVSQVPSTFLNNIYDMLTGSFYYDGSTRVAGSGSAWSASIKFQTGSNTEAVVCRPPLYTAISQSIIFAGKAAAAPFSTATVPVATNAETPDFTAQSREVMMTTVKNATGSFTEWTSQFPFGTGSYSTGYVTLTRCAVLTGAGQKITIYESKEAMAVIVSFPNAYCHATFAGAIVDPEQAAASLDAETDGRLYGIATSGAQPISGNPSGMNPNFMTFTTDTIQVNSGSLFGHTTTQVSTTEFYPRFVVLTPQQNSTIPVTAEKTNVNTIAYFSFSGKTVQIPVKCVGKFTNYYIGRLRDVNSVRPFLLNQVIRDQSNNIVGYAIAASEYALPTTNVSAVCLPYN